MLNKYTAEVLRVQVQLLYSNAINVGPFDPIIYKLRLIEGQINSILLFILSIAFVFFLIFAIWPAVTWKMKHTRLYDWIFGFKKGERKTCHHEKGTLKLLLNKTHLIFMKNHAKSFLGSRSVIKKIDKNKNDPFWSIELIQKWCNFHFKLQLDTQNVNGNDPHLQMSVGLCRYTFDHSPYNTIYAALVWNLT